MCIIIDACVFSDRRHGRKESSNKLFEWVRDGKSKVAIGGKLLDEYGKMFDALKWLQEVQRKKYHINVDNDEVNAETGRVDQEGKCKSNDSHIIALARVSGARLLHSTDNDLHTDFTNPKILNTPRGNVYPTLKEWDWKFTKKHSELLEKSHCAKS